MKIVLKILMSILVFANGAHAGGWTSGGGENIRDERNPWWLQNTKEITYCIKIDRANFGQSTQVIRQKINFAFNFWKKQLKTLTWSEIDKNEHLAVGTQNFTETPCREGTDLVFQFGVLDGEQFRYLGDPTKFIGVTVRTDYNPVNLRAKGFIYISPENGPLKLNKLGLMQNPWSHENGILLTPALIHELGHLFGVSHQKELHIMMEDFLETLLAFNSRQWVAEIWRNIERADLKNEIFLFKYEPIALSGLLCASVILEPPKGPITTPHFPRQFSPTAYYSILSDFFGFRIPDKGNTCFDGGLFKKNDKYFYQFSYTHNGKDYKVGRTSELERQDDGYFNLISIWLPKSQKVFENLWTATESSIHIASFKPITYFKGEYRSYDGATSRPISIKAEPLGSLTVGGILNGKYYFDVFRGF